MSDPVGWPKAPTSGPVALLGGSFNPPHVAHALLAQAVLATQKVQSVWVLPCADHAFGKPLAPFLHRLQMCRLAFRWLGDAVRVLDVEAHLPAPNYTLQTLRSLKEAHPQIQPRWVIGSDILAELHRWREPERVQELCSFIVFPRGGHPDRHSSHLSPTATTLAFSLPEISSSQIRERLAQGAKAAGLLDRAVDRYCRQNGLYLAAPAAAP